MSATLAGLFDASKSSEPHLAAIPFTPRTAEGDILEVWRKGKLLKSGRLEELVARASELRATDEIAGWSHYGRCGLYSIAELARVVPSAAEATLSRVYANLLAFDCFLGVFAVLGIGFAIAAKNPLDNLRMVFLVVGPGILIFGLPLVKISRDLKRERMQRLSGRRIVTPPALPSDRALTSSLAAPNRTSAILVAVIAMTSLTAWFVPGAIEMFMKDNAKVYAGELWRLVTPMFLHAGIFHLVLNLTALLLFAQRSANLFSTKRMLLAFFVTGVCASIASVLTNPAPMVGASGGIFGLVGLVTGYLVRYRRRLPRATSTALLKNLLLIVGFNLVYGFAAFQIDNAAHIGGLLAGLALALVLKPDPRLLAARA